MIRRSTPQFAIIKCTESDGDFTNSIFGGCLGSKWPQTARLDSV